MDFSVDRDRLFMHRKGSNDSFIHCNWYRFIFAGFETTKYDCYYKRTMPSHTILVKTAIEISTAAIAIAVIETSVIEKVVGFHVVIIVTKVLQRNLH